MRMNQINVEFHNERVVIEAPANVLDKFHEFSAVVDCDNFNKREKPERMLVTGIDDDFCVPAVLDRLARAINAVIN